MIDLFPDLPESLSPKEDWKRRNRITVRPPTEDKKDWFAFAGEVSVGACALGATEDEALLRLASLLGVTHWF